jgi:hypothetical protein
MALCIEKQQQNARKIAEFLSFHPLIKKVYYAGLPGHPSHGLFFPGKGRRFSSYLLNWFFGSFTKRKRKRYVQYRGPRGYLMTLCLIHLSSSRSGLWRSY